MLTPKVTYFDLFESPPCKLFWNFIEHLSYILNIFRDDYYIMHSDLTKHYLLPLDLIFHDQVGENEYFGLVHAPRKNKI